MMRYALRRLLILPLMLVLAAVVFALLPVVGAVQAIVALGVVFGRRPRWRALRLWAFAAVYCAGECLCVLACLLLWLASLVPRRRNGDRWRARHVQALSWHLGMLMCTAELVIALRLKLECPRGETIGPDRPVIVLGPGTGRCAATGPDGGGGPVLLAVMEIPQDMLGKPDGPFPLHLLSIPVLALPAPRSGSLPPRSALIG